MITLRALIVGTLALATGTAADGFWVAKKQLHTLGGRLDPKTGPYIFVDDIKDCDQITRAPLFHDRGDVSQVRGVRVKFKAQGDKMERLVLLEVEWNTGKAHATWYADRDGAVVDIQGKQLFKCKADTSQRRTCRLPSGGRAEVISIIHCDGAKPAQ